jgi:hypothetical protein
MSQSLQDTLQQIENHNRNIVMHQTWGHLGAEVGKHPGSMLFTVGQYGDLTVINSSWKDAEGQEVPGSPWLYAVEHEFVGQHYKKEPGVYRVTGYYEMHKKGTGRICGKVTLIAK